MYLRSASGVEKKAATCYTPKESRSPKMRKRSLFRSKHLNKIGDSEPKNMGQNGGIHRWPSWWGSAVPSQSWWSPEATEVTRWTKKRLRKSEQHGWTTGFEQSSCKCGILVYFLYLLLKKMAFRRSHRKSCHLLSAMCCSAQRRNCWRHSWCCSPRPWFAQRIGPGQAKRFGFFVAKAVLGVTFFVAKAARCSMSSWFLLPGLD